MNILISTDILVNKTELIFNYIYHHWTFLFLFLLFYYFIILLFYYFIILLLLLLFKSHPLLENSTEDNVLKITNIAAAGQCYTCI